VQFLSSIFSLERLKYSKHTFWQQRLHIFKRQIKGFYCLPCFVLLVLLVAAAKIHFEDQALVGAGNTKGGSITVQLTSCLTGLD
jgi:hypothetical protein